MSGSPYDRDTPTLREWATAYAGTTFGGTERSPAWDKPVCACTECVLWSLLDGVLDELTALWPPGPERDARHPRPHPDAGRLA